MTTRNTILLLALAVALAACGRSKPPVDNTDLQTAASIASAVPDKARVVEPVDLDVLEFAALDPQSDDTEAVPETSEEPVYADFELRHGESLYHFAKWARLPVETVAEASGLDLSGDYAVGTTVRLPIEGEALSHVIGVREAHHVMRAEGYLASRGGSVGAEFVTVRTGENAWKIAHDQQGIPIWLLQTYNPSVDLELLRPGQQLMVPVIADIVVDADMLEAPID
jgi:hypothetical protein